MPSLLQISLPALKPFGPAALTVAAVIATALLARTGEARNVAPELVRHRLRLPNGVARWLIIPAAGLIALLILGIDWQTLGLTLVPVLCLIALGFAAMWRIWHHMLASIFIAVFRPFEVGDQVEITGDDPVSGEVMDVNAVYTTLRIEEGGTLHVPNNLFFQKALKRHVRRRQRLAADVAGLPS